MCGPDFFSDSYEVARHRFIETATAAQATLSTHAIDIGSDSSRLYIDVARLGAPAPHWVLLVTSGVHGVDGYFGSAVQLAWLHHHSNGAHRWRDGAIVFIHGVNPYGFAYCRRTNEDNVDLNRNFHDSWSESRTSAPEYETLDPLLNPSGPPSRFDPFRFKALWQIRRHGLTTLKSAVAGGQYLFPRGLFYGGRHVTQSTQTVMSHLANWVGSAERVLHVDLHSGLGRFGQHRLLLEEPVGSPAAQWYRDRLGSTTVEPAGTPAATTYRATGTLGAWAQRALPRVRYRFATAEFGTYSVVLVLGALRAENQAHFYAARDSSRQPRAKEELRECFCPRSTRWQEDVIAGGLELLSRAKDAIETDRRPQG